MTLTDFLDFILPTVPGCPSPVAKKAAIEAAIEFLTESQAWNEIQDALPVADNAQEYDLDAPTGARCIDIKAVYTRCGELVPVTIEQLAARMSDWQAAEGNVPQLYTRAFDFTTFRVYPKPTEPGVETMRVHGVYTLKRSSTTIPDDIVDRYGKSIASGALRDLLVIPKTTWQDLNLAVFHKNEFETAKTMAKITAAHGKTAGAISVRPRRFGQ